MQESLDSFKQHNGDTSTNYVELGRENLCSNVANSGLVLHMQSHFQHLSGARISKCDSGGSISQGPNPSNRMVYLHTGAPKDKKLGEYRKVRPT